VPRRLLQPRTTRPWSDWLSSGDLHLSDGVWKWKGACASLEDSNPMGQHILGDNWWGFGFGSLQAHGQQAMMPSTGDDTVR